jgi:preprotein translocase subunit SecA
LATIDLIRFGTRTGYDKQHRRINQRTEKFQYAAWTAEQVQAWDPDRLRDVVRQHLSNALSAWEETWGQQELQRIGAYNWADLDETTRAGFAKVLSDEQSLEGKRISDLSPEQMAKLRAHLGRQVMFNVQRQLMLEITSHYWVEHLTAMEMLRQGIGLQSYAQKDPLAEYKVRAFDMFQELLLAIQTEIVTAMFTYRPRDLSQVRVGVERKKQTTGTPSSGQKGKRRKKRKKR